MQLDQKELLDIKQIIVIGNRKPEDYQILFYKEIYNEEKTVRIRGLSNFEFEQISLDMYSEIKDTKTINYVFDQMYAGKSVSDKELPDGVNAALLTKAFLLRDALIVHNAMKDYYPNLTLDEIKQLEGIEEIADKVREKSGRTKEIMKKIDFFRSKSSEPGNTNTNQQGL